MRKKETKQKIEQMECVWRGWGGGGMREGWRGGGGGKKQKTMCNILQ